MANVTRDGFHGFGKDPTGEADKNRAVTDVYEPGSIFKLVTISGALADGVVTPNTRFTLPPIIHVADRDGARRRAARHRQLLGHADPRSTPATSAPSGSASKMGEAGMYKWLKAYGFGKPTGIQFPGETGGIVPPLKLWSGSSIGNIPMGQGIAVTAIQMASAFSAVADNGWQVRPRLVAQVGTKVYDTVEKHRVIPAKVARQVRQMLLLAVEKGTGKDARIPGYEVAGKTGTAEMPLEDGSGYAKNIYVSSFIGMVPADHPRLVVLVRRERRHRSSAAPPRLRRSRRSCSSRSSTWRSHREQRTQACCRAGRRRRPALRPARGSGRIRRDEAERACSRGLRRHGARRSRHRDPRPRLPHA